MAEPQKSTLNAMHLARKYQGRFVVEDISIRLSQGEIVGLLGPNGAGKTTAFYMIVGLIKPSQGNIFLDQENISKLPMHLRARKGISYLPQESSIFQKLSVADNILGILETRADLTPEERHFRLETLLEEFHLTHIRDRKGISLSGGERRRTEIARALTNDPRFILLDEPFAGVDPISVIDIKRIIRQLKARGIGVLITDHNVRETLDICERAYIAAQGHILATGTPQEILANSDVRKIYLGDSFIL